MTVFFTRCCKRHSLFWSWVAVFVFFAAAVFPVAAEGIEVARAGLVSTEEGYFLEADFEITLNPTLDEALHKGVPLYFLLEFEVIRPRCTGSMKKFSARSSSIGCRITL